MPPQLPSTKPKLISRETLPDLPKLLEELELYGGNLESFLVESRGAQQRIDKEAILFQIYTELAKEENKEFKKRWEIAIERSAKLRLKLLQCKALEILERFHNPVDKSPSPEIAYCNLVLGDILQARNELAKQRVLPQILPQKEVDELDEIQQDIEMLTSSDESE